MLYGSRKTLELLDEARAEEVSSDGLLDDLHAQQYEIRKERQKFFDQRRELNKLLAAEGRREHLYDVLSDAARKLGESVGNLWNDVEDAVFVPGDEDKEAVVVFSDWHYGMVCDNVFNKFDTEICRERVKRVTEMAARRISFHGCSGLHVVVLGDLIHGAIHTSARVASEEIVCEQIMHVSEILSQAILMLSSYVDHTTVHVTYGNHGRTVQSKQDNLHRDNMERLIPWWMKERFKSVGRKDITVADESDSEFILLSPAGHHICAVHGDLDSVKSSPRLLATLFERKYGVGLEYILLGDKHHRESFEELGVTAEICGSLCGTDEYANTKRLFSTPSQLLLVVDREAGVDAEYRLAV